MLQASTGINPHAESAHLIQLFNSEDSLADGVAQFFGAGLLQNEQMLALVSEERWYSIAMRLSARGQSADEALRFGRLIVRDAKHTLGKFMFDGKIKPRLFHATVGTLVEGMAAFRRPVRIYGDLVDALVSEGDFAAALELEQLWNQLARRHRFTLLCGYSAGHFGDPRNTGDLHRICEAHNAVRSNPEDVLGAFLVSRSRAA